MDRPPFEDENEHEIFLLPRWAPDEQANIAAMSGYIGLHGMPNDAACILFDRAEWPLHLVQDWHGLCRFVVLWPKKGQLH